MEFLLITLALLFVGIIAAIIIHIIRKLEPYPFCHITKDVSGRRNLVEQTFVEECLCEEINRNKIFNQTQSAIEWKNRMYEKHPTQKEKIDNIFNTHNGKDIIFEAQKRQTRYSQHNYIKSSYYIYVTTMKILYTQQYCSELIEELKQYNFEATLQNIHSKEQRKLITPQLKNEIKIRDNYTCQICGKYMPDEVGLHIDHIVAIKNGGKTLRDNLQVLCSKCNGSKSGK